MLYLLIGQKSGSNRTQLRCSVTTIIFNVAPFLRYVVLPSIRQISPVVIWQSCFSFFIAPVFYFPSFHHPFTSRLATATQLKRNQQDAQRLFSARHFREHDLQIIESIFCLTVKATLNSLSFQQLQNLLLQGYTQDRRAQHPICVIYSLVVPS